MNRIAQAGLLFVLLSAGFVPVGDAAESSSPAEAASEPAEAAMELLCRPTQAKAPAARRINVLKLVGDKLYIGHGDYGVNTGPTDILYYDLAVGETVKEGVVDDEAITRYRNLDGMLVIPGVDATEDWSFGNCYTLEDGKWLKHRTIPGGLHVWDIVSYHDRWYVGTHACFDFSWGPKDEVRGQPGTGMLLSSGDNGKTWRFEYSPAIDTNVDSFTRNLVVFQDKLYAFPDAQTFPNTKEFAARAGENAKPLDDAFASMDTLVYDGELWQPVNLVREPKVRHIVPIPVGEALALYVHFQDHKTMYAYDGKTAREVSFKCDQILAVLPKTDRTYLLIRRDGRHLLAETADAMNWQETLLPEAIGEPLSIECRDDVLFAGTRDGAIWRGKRP